MTSVSHFETVRGGSADEQVVPRCRYFNTNRGETARDGLEDAPLGRGGGKTVLNEP